MASRRAISALYSESCLISEHFHGYSQKYKTASLKHLLNISNTQWNIIDGGDKNCNTYAILDCQRRRWNVGMEQKLNSSCHATIMKHIWWASNIHLTCSRCSDCTGCNTCTRCGSCREKSCGKRFELRQLRSQTLNAKSGYIWQSRGHQLHKIT